MARLIASVGFGNPRSNSTSRASCAERANASRTERASKLGGAGLYTVSRRRSPESTSRSTIGPTILGPYASSLGPTALGSQTRRRRASSSLSHRPMDLRNRYPRRRASPRTSAARARFFSAAPADAAGSAGPPGTPLAVHPGGGAFPLRASCAPRRRTPPGCVRTCRRRALAEGLHREPKRARDFRDAHASLASRRAQRHEAVLHARLQLHRFPAHGFQKGFPRRDARLVTSGTVERVVGFRGAEAARTRRRLGAGERRRRQTQRVHRHESRLARFRVRHGRVRLWRTRRRRAGRATRARARIACSSSRERSCPARTTGTRRSRSGASRRARARSPVRHHALRRRRAL